MHKLVAKKKKKKNVSVHKKHAHKYVTLVMMLMNPVNAT